MNSNLGSSLMGCSGLFSKVGCGTLVGIEPVLVNAEDFLRNSERAAMPSLEPRISGRAMVLDTFSRCRGDGQILHIPEGCVPLSLVSRYHRGMLLGLVRGGGKIVVIPLLQSSLLIFPYYPTSSLFAFRTVGYFFIVCISPQGRPSTLVPLWLSDF